MRGLLTLGTSLLLCGFAAAAEAQSPGRGATAWWDAWRLRAATAAGLDSRGAPLATVALDAVPHDTVSAREREFGALRLEGMWVSERIGPRTLSVLASAVSAPRRPRRVEPYWVAGFGMYGLGEPDDQLGAHYGVGLRSPVGRAVRRVELRYHTE
jgi:hypothetical protein